MKIDTYRTWLFNHFGQSNIRFFLTENPDNVGLQARFYVFTNNSLNGKGHCTQFNHNTLIASVILYSKTMQPIKLINIYVSLQTSRTLGKTNVRIGTREKGTSTVVTHPPAI